MPHYWSRRSHRLTRRTAYCRRAAYGLSATPSKPSPATRRVANPRWLAVGDGEGAAELERCPPRVGGVGGAECGAVVSDKLAPVVVVVQRRQDRTQRGPLDPLEHGVVAAQHMQVRRLPH